MNFRVNPSPKDYVCGGSGTTQHIVLGIDNRVPSLPLD